MTRFSNPLLFRQVGTPAGNPGAGSQFLYFKSDGNLYTKDSTGVETQVAGSTGGVTTLDSLSDVTVTNPLTGSVIRWSGTEWYNSPILGVDLGTSYDSSQAKVLTSGGSVAAWSSISLDYLPGEWLKKRVKVATPGTNNTLTGTQVLDGVSVSAGDRVLVKNQTTASQNGIYIASETAWTRAPDADTAAEMAGALVTVDQGSANAGTKWYTKFRSNDALGSTAMTWFQVSDNTTYSVPTQAEAEAGTATTARVWTAERVKQAINAISPQVKARTVTTTGIVLSGLQTINGEALVAGDVVLVAHQGAAKDNGVYVVSPGAWTRHPRYTTAADFAGGTVRVLAATIAEDEGLWHSYFGLNGTVGTDQIIWSKILDRAVADGRYMLTGSRLENLSGVDVLAPSDGHVLTWDAVYENWVNTKVGLLQATPELAVAGRSAVLNWNFEEKSIYSQFPYGWNGSWWSGSGQTWSRDTLAPIAGAASVKIDLANSSAGYRVKAERTAIPVVPGQQWDLTALVKASRAIYGSWLTITTANTQANLYDTLANGTTVIWQDALKSPAGTTPTAVPPTRFTVPAGHYWLGVFLHAPAANTMTDDPSGTVSTTTGYSIWYDEIVLTQAASPTPYCKIVKNAQQSVSNNTGEQITFQAVRVDSRGDMADTAANVIRIKEPGDYEIQAGIRFVGNATGIRSLRVDKNTEPLAGNTAQGIGNAWGNFVNISTTAYGMVVGDYVRAHTYQNSGAALSTSTDLDATFLSVRKIR